MPVPAPLLPMLSLLRGRRAGYFAGAVVCLAVAVLFELPEVPAFCAWMNMEGPRGGAVWILRVPVLGFVVAGVWLLDLGIRSRPEDAPMLRALLEKPGSIVWVHAKLAIERQAYGATVGRSRILCLMTTSGAGFSLEVTEAALDRALDGLETYLPHATFGWTEERERKYHESPELLRVVPSETAYRGAPPQDAARIRPPRGAPFGVGAIVVAALLLARMALMSPGFTCGAPAREPDRVALAPVPAVASMAPAVTVQATPVVPGDIAADETFVYYTVPSDNDLFAQKKSAPDRRRIVRSRTLGAIAVSGRALYYVADGALWKVPEPYAAPVQVAGGFADAYDFVVAGKRAYALTLTGIGRVDLSSDAASPEPVWTVGRAHAIATDGARVFFARDTLQMIDDRTGRASSPGPTDGTVGAIAVCGAAVYFTRRAEGLTALHSLDAPARAIAEVQDGRAIACDAGAVYWVDASGFAGIVKRRSRGGKEETLAEGVPYDAKLAVDAEHVWFTVAGGVTHWDKPKGMR